MEQTQTLVSTLPVTTAIDAHGYQIATTVGNAYHVGGGTYVVEAEIDGHVVRSTPTKGTEYDARSALHLALFGATPLRLANIGGGSEPVDKR